MIEYIDGVTTARMRARRLVSEPGGKHGRFGECRAPWRRRSAFISKPHKLLIDGWVAPKGGKSFKVFDPATGVQIAQVAEGGPEDIDLAVKAARKAFEEGPWSKIKPVERGKMVWRLGDLLEKHLVELAEIESLDNGKPVSDAKAVDLPFGCELLRYMGGWSTKITGQSIPISAPGDWHAYSMREPVASWARSSRGTSRC
jgi:phenylacetaldehyde dehydrogenase